MNKRNFSKVIAVFSIGLFTTSVLAGIITSLSKSDTSIYMYIIPATGTLATAAASFYYAKSKAENLSKQRIRYHLMRLLLEDKINCEDYQEICAEIENIDAVIAQKLDCMTADAVNSDETNITNI